MNTKMFMLLIAFMVSLLSGCATQVPRVAGVDMPLNIKTGEYYKTHLMEVTSAANAGDAAAQFELAYIYSGSRIGDRDIQKSNFWMEKSAAQDYFSAAIGLAGRHQEYAEWGYKKDNVLADDLVSRAYTIYLSKPASSWTTFDVQGMAALLLSRAELHIQDKDFAQHDLCTALQMGITNKYGVDTIHQDLRKIGRTCK